MAKTEKKQEDIVVFAQTTGSKAQRHVGIKTNDRRQHMYLLGTAGTGKSTTLANMIYQDIHAGRGVAVVDPYGRLAEKVLNFIPPHRINDVIYFNPTDIEHSFSFNVLEDVDVSYRHFLVVSGLISIFKTIWADVWGPQLEYVLRNIILALLEYPGSTLLGIMRILSDDEFREQVIEHMSDPVVKSFWTDEYPRYPEHLQAEVITPICNKIGELFSTPLVRNIVGQIRSKINARDIIDTGKILIMNLSRAQIGEDASTLLGGMMMVKIQMAAMSRINMSEDKRRDFYLYVDGFQNFATDSFVDILADAHKYHLNLIIAHQYISQLAKSRRLRLRDAIFNTIKTKVIYRVSAEDRVFLSKKFSKKVDLVNLDKYHVYIKLMVDGTASKPFSAVSLPPLSKPQRHKNKIIAISREQYTEPRLVVEEKIARWRGLIREGEHLTSGMGRDMYEAKCDTCDTKVHISFIPDGIRPVFCKKCLKAWKKRQEKEQEQKSLSPPEISLEEAMKKDPVSFKKKS